MKIDYKILKSACLSSVESFSNIGVVEQTKDGILISRCKDGNRVLAVAHLDSVLALKHFYVNTIDGRDYVFNAQLDDRLGAYIILSLLPSLGLKYDILLTEGEETARSTAQYFTSDKQYNWMFSFDRRGDDVVMYDYDNVASRELLKRHKFNPSTGSFSDICFLDQLGCIGFNFGTGYYGEHSDLCYADIDTTLKQVRKFVPFFNDNCNTPMPYIVSHKTSGFRYANFEGRGLEGAYGEFDRYGEESVVQMCSMCGYELLYTEAGICEDCAIENGLVCETCGSMLNPNHIEYCEYCESRMMEGD